MKSANKCNRRISRRANPPLYRYDMNPDLLLKKAKKKKWKWNVLQGKQLLMLCKCITTQWKCTIFSPIYLFISICTKQASLSPVALTGSVSSILKRKSYNFLSQPRKPTHQKRTTQKTIERTSIEENNNRNLMAVHRLELSVHMRKH